MVDARDRLEITLTPAALQVMHELATAFTRSTREISPAAFQALETPLALQNDLGPWAKIILLTRAEVSIQDVHMKSLQILNLNFKEIIGHRSLQFAASCKATQKGF